MGNTFSSQLGYGTQPTRNRRQTPSTHSEIREILIRTKMQIAHVWQMSAKQLSLVTRGLLGMIYGIDICKKTYTVYLTNSSQIVNTSVSNYIHSAFTFTPFFIAFSSKDTIRFGSGKNTVKMITNFSIFPSLSPQLQSCRHWFQPVALLYKK